MQGYRIPAALGGEIDALEALIADFGREAISAAELKAHRVPFGVYEQRTRGTYMVRIRCTAGIITPRQLAAIAHLAIRYGSGRLHVTTRQELQIHDVSLDRIIPVLRELASTGLSTRGGGGNTVRNITASWDAGIASTECFDVTPFAVELTSRLIARSDSWLLPRKFKIAFSGGDNDNALATINDLGFVARVKDGRQGFRVFVAGGMGRSPQPGHLLHDFAGIDEVFEIAESVKRLFSRFGNRRNRHTARLRFLWNTLTPEVFIGKYREIRQEVAAEGHAPFPGIHTLSGTNDNDDVVAAPSAPAGNREQWKQRHTGLQRQAGLYRVRVPLTLGDIPAAHAIELANALLPFGDDVIRFTQNQNVVLRNLPEQALDIFGNLLRKVAPRIDRPPVLTNAVACAGASTCQLGICLSRGALEATAAHLIQQSIDLDALGDFRLHFSGCSNSCGQHAVADLGFYGKAGRREGRAYPAYTVVAGGRPDGNGGTVLATKTGDIPARSVPAFTGEFLGHYASLRKSYATYQEYLAAQGYAKLASLIEKYNAVAENAVGASMYIDWGGTTEFSLEGRGTGECAAGLFDLIEIGLAQVRQLREQLEGSAVPISERAGLLRTLAVTAMRSLFPAVGETASSEREIPEQFTRHFVETGIVGPEFGPVVASVNAGDLTLLANEQGIVNLSAEVERLYAGLDDSLRFPPAVAHEAPLPAPHLEKDFRGVTCPMNFVKTKLALAQLTPGQVLRILLDSGDPVENVPRSVEAEGHRILDRKQVADYWQITILKGK
jgi:sulfite reductase (ferredoxin)